MKFSMNCAFYLALWLTGVQMLCTPVYADYGQVDAKHAEILSASAKADTIILLQGMGRGRASLCMLDTRLQHAGYSTANFPFLAHSHSIDALAEQLCKFIVDNVKTERYHLIAHSLGNLIVRAGFRAVYPHGLGRIVILAPPNQPPDLALA